MTEKFMPVSKPTITQKEILIKWNSKIDRNVIRKKH